MLSYKRSVRVAELLQQEISKIIQELKEPELGFVTVTGVKLTEDLQTARVFYSVIGSPEEIERSRHIINGSRQEIRRELASRVNLRRTPTLDFEYDETPTRATRVFEILEKIKTGEAAERQEKNAPRRKTRGASRGKQAKRKSGNRENGGQ